MSETLLQVENLRTYFHTFRGVVKAVDGISFSLDEGQVLVDGVDVREYSLNHLREGVGMVLQKNVLFSSTVPENRTFF